MPGWAIVLGLVIWCGFLLVAVLFIFIDFLMAAEEIGEFEIILFVCMMICRSLAMYGILRCYLHPKYFFTESRFVVLALLLYIFLLCVDCGAVYHCRSGNVAAWAII